MENDCKLLSSRGIMYQCEAHPLSPFSGSSSLANYSKPISESRVVYVCTNALSNFLNILSTMRSSFVLVSGDSDESPTSVLGQRVSELLEHSLMVHWFAQNCDLVHSKITAMPIGLDYHTLRHASDNHEWGPRSSPINQELLLRDIASRAKPFWKRIPKCHANYHFAVKGKKFAHDREEALLMDRECVDYERRQIARLDTWVNQSRYAFVVSPLGNGYDCHRTWEALCLGCIVVIKTSLIDPVFEGLPVLIVDSYKAVTKELLLSTMEEYRERRFDLSKLTLAYWRAEIFSPKEL